MVAVLLLVRPKTTFRQQSYYWLLASHGWKSIAGCYSPIARWKLRSPARSPACFWRACSTMPHWQAWQKVLHLPGFKLGAKSVLPDRPVGTSWVEQKGGEACLVLPAQPGPGTAQQCSFHCSQQGGLWRSSFSAQVGSRVLCMIFTLVVLFYYWYLRMGLAVVPHQKHWALNYFHSAQHSPKWQHMHYFPLPVSLEQAIPNDVSHIKKKFIFILMEFQEANSSAPTLTGSAWRVLIAVGRTQQVCKRDI